VRLLAKDLFLAMTRLPPFGVVNGWMGIWLLIRAHTLTVSGVQTDGDPLTRQLGATRIANVIPAQQ
jgi:hypothetical protein